MLYEDSNSSLCLYYHYIEVTELSIYFSFPNDLWKTQKVN